MSEQHSKPSILMVDDLKQNLIALDAILEGEGYELHQALSGEEALKFLLNNQVDMILMDVCMPNINGIETAAIVRKHEKFKDVPIIFITACEHDSSLVNAAYNLDAIDFLYKPVDPGILLSKVRVLLTVLKRKEMMLEQERKQKAIVKEYAVQLNTITAEIEQVKNALDEFTYIASHDLREPLRGVFNYAQFLYEDYESILPAEGIEKLNTIMDLARRQDEQIQALLDYSRAGQMSDSTEEIDVRKMLEGLQGDLCALIEEKRVRVSVGEVMPVVCGHGTAISRIFYNLILNGIKYNDSEDRRIEIGYEGGSGVFSVSDNGIGVEEKNRENIFKIFRRLKGSDEYSTGTGAGLTIVKKIVESYGGKIWVEPGQGGGSRFCFTLPNAEAEMREEVGCGA